MALEIYDLLIIIFGLSAVILFFNWGFMAWMKREVLEVMYHELVRVTERAYGPSDVVRQALVPRTAQEKKDAIRKMGPKTFYYIDESQVRDLYDQVVEELEPRRIETRESKETRKGIAVNFRLIKPKYEKGRAEEITRTYDLKRTPAMMYNKVEHYLIEKGQVTFGLEDFEYDESSINEFRSMCDRMRKEFEFEIPSDIQDGFVLDKIAGFALKHIEKLSDSSGYVAIQSEFSVIDVTDVAYLLSLAHPLNDFSSKQMHNVRIQIICNKTYSTPSGVNTFGKNRLVKITCLGKVVSWNLNDEILEITPIAIY